MNAKDAISAKLAECFITIGRNRYNFMQAINVEAKFEKKKSEVPVLGRTGTGNKSTGWSGSGSCTAHYNSNIIRQMLVDYKNTGKDLYFDMQITNDDPSSDAGAQTVELYNCNVDGGILAKFDADGEYLEEDFDFTFEDFAIPKTFNLLPGMYSAR